jgi:tRNA pseudouridine(38-40) synthase
MIHELCQGDPHKTGWGRASRTDKGVHAAMNGINVKLDIRNELLRDGLTDEDIAKGKKWLKHQIDRKKFCDTVNAFLPDQLRVFDLKVVTKSFGIKDKVHKRRYEYLIPFKVFYPYTKNVEELSKFTPLFGPISNLCRKFKGR